MSGDDQFFDELRRAVEEIERTTEIVPASEVEGPREQSDEQDGREQ